jgi:hypothetical protein
MVQGKTKGLTSKAPNSRQAKKAAANTKKGQRHIAPKKTALVKQATLNQVRLIDNVYYLERNLTPSRYLELELQDQCFR